MITNEHELLYKDEVYQIIGCAFEVHNTLGCGFLEKPYENSLAVEFENQKIPFKQQAPLTLSYKGKEVGNYIADFIIQNKIILEIKCIKELGDIERAQILNYLNITKKRLGLLINFKPPTLEWERIIL